MVHAEEDLASMKALSMDQRILETVNQRLNGDGGNLHGNLLLFLLRNPSLDLDPFDRRLLRIGNRGFRPDGRTSSSLSGSGVLEGSDLSQRTPCDPRQGQKYERPGPEIKGGQSRALSGSLMRKPFMTPTIRRDA